MHFVAHKLVQNGDNLTQTISIHLHSAVHHQHYLKLLFLLLSMEFMAVNLHNKVSQGVKNVANFYRRWCMLHATVVWIRKLIKSKPPYNRNLQNLYFHWTMENFSCIVTSHLAHRRVVDFVWLTLVFWVVSCDSTPQAVRKSNMITKNHLDSVKIPFVCVRCMHRHYAAPWHRVWCKRPRCE